MTAKPKKKPAKKTAKSKKKPAKAKAPPARQRAEEALAIASGQLSSILESTGDIIAMMDTDYRYAVFNTAFREEFRRLFGVKLVPGDSMLQALAGLPEDLANARTYWDRALAGEDFTVTQQFGDTKLERHWYELHFSPIRDTGGRIAGAVHVVRNISERKRAEEQVRLLSSITENTSDAIIVSDLSFAIAYVNKAGEQLHGYTLDELRGKTPDIFNAEPDSARIQQEIYGAVSSGKTYVGESLNRRKDGSTFHCEYRVMPLDDSDGNPIAYIGIQRDITERKRAEDALRESQTRFQALVETNGDFIWELDPHGCYTYCSPQMERLWGLNPREMLGKTPFDLVLPEDREQAIKGYSALSESLSIFQNMEVRSLDGTGQIRFLEIGGVPFLNREGKLAGYRGTTRDVTERKRAEEALRVSDARLADSAEQRKMILDALPQLVSFTDADLIYRFVNRSYEKFFECKVEDIVGRSLPEVIGPAAWKLAEHHVRRALAGEVVDYDEVFEYPDMEARHMMGYLLPHRGTTGSVDGYFAVLNDVTRLFAMHEALRESEARFRNAMDATQDGLWDWDVPNAHVYYSPAYLGMLGYLPDELPTSTPNTWLDLVHPEDRDRAMAANQACVRNESQTVDAEFRMRAKDGSWRWIRGRGRAVRRDAEGQALQMIGTHVDITDRKRAEEALKATNAKLARAQRIAHIGSWEDHLPTGELHWSEEMFSIMGLPPSNSVNLAEAVRAFPPEELDRFEKAVRAATDEGALYSQDYRIARPDGSMRHIHDEGEIVCDEQGKATWMYGTTQDITARKRAEEEKAGLEAQLQQAQKMELVGRLAGGVAHDFNNMLGVILGHAEVALGRVGQDQQLHGHLAEIHKAAQRSANLTRQLLAFARKQTIAPKVLDLNETIEGILKMLRRLIGEDIQLAWQPEAGLWPVRVDPSQIDQVLANLCLNARDAIADVGKITIETANSDFDADYCALHAGFAPGEYVRLAVSDDGCGMDKETLAHVFEPFFTTKDVGAGTGLGLATVYGIVKQNDGFINAYSEPGQGTTFSIYLRRHAGKAEQASTEDAAEPLVRGQETILLVEDEPAILEMTKEMLELHGYVVVAAGTPGEAIRMAREHAGEIHLLMTDVVMPEMNGRDLAKNLLALYPHLKRLFTSGYSADLIAHRGVLDDGVHFLQKPFSMKGLAAKVRQALESN